uniref:Uncharacterized protein n=1 Tax=Meloidogyne enterolobii TaxID=390850 RepID=A0A6V7XLE5_MELEN|nr:unnamed protein product [Meloidogyne enterolobii]
MSEIMEGIVTNANPPIVTNANPPIVEKKKYLTDTVKECHEQTINLIQQLLPKIHDSILTNVEKIVRENLKGIEAKVEDQTVSIVRIAEKLDETVTNKNFEELSLGSTPEPNEEIEIENGPVNPQIQNGQIQNDGSNNHNERGRRRGRRGNRNAYFNNHGSNRERSRYFYAARQDRRQQEHCSCHQCNRGRGRRFRAGPH